MEGFKISFSYFLINDDPEFSILYIKRGLTISPPLAIPL